MKNQLFNKRIPTILGIGFIILGIVLTTTIVRNQTSLKSKASNSEEPKNVKFTNLSNDSFTIIYQTDAAAAGSINYGKGKELGSTELEDPDKEKGNFSPRTIHSITVKKLSPNTKYNLVIISGQNTFLNNGATFEIATAKDSSPSADNTFLKGKVVLPDGKVPDEALVFLNTEDSQLLSSAVGKNGEFNFSLKSLLSSDLSSYIEVNKNTIFKLLAISNSLKSTALVSLNETNSIPTITLSNDYDFTHELIPVASKSAQSDRSGFPAISTNKDSQKPQILTPKKDQSFTDQKPQFRGTSLPNEKVEITIHSDENIQTQVTSDSNGNWIYRPPNTLSPGIHTITIKTRDASGILTTLMQSFTVFAQGSQVSESATPSATPTQKVTPTSTPTPTRTLTPIPSPTITVVVPSPTPMLTLLPTALPIESKGGLPPTGHSSVGLIIGGIFIGISGIALFLLTRTIP